MSKNQILLSSIHIYQSLITITYKWKLSHSLEWAVYKYIGGDAPNWRLPCCIAIFEYSSWKGTNLVRLLPFTFKSPCVVGGEEEKQAKTTVLVKAPCTSFYLPFALEMEDHANSLPREREGKPPKKRKHERDKTRVYMVVAFPSWRQLMSEKDLNIDVEVASFLLDRSLNLTVTGVMLEPGQCSPAATGSSCLSGIICCYLQYKTAETASLLVSLHWKSSAATVFTCCYSAHKS